MEKSYRFLRVISYILFIVFISIGLLYLLAAPVIPALTLSRLIIGITLIVLGILILVVISILIQRKRQAIVRIPEQAQFGTTDQSTVPVEIICRECQAPIEITEDLRGKKSVICESCGTENLIPRSKVKW